ncbi:MAG: DUF5320 domain-containing protein [Candidatus Lokiarchaeota archaeon]|nr:DUF5320 domain-containing protein [Candidatus Lokiarchaeota archaeon]
MPGGDRTGPAGLGSRTGRGLGYCSGYESPGYTKAPGGFWRGGFGYGGNYPYGRGLGRGRGRRWGLRGNINYFPIPQPYIRPIEWSSEQKITFLNQEKEYLNNEIQSLKERLDEILKEIENIDNKQ